MSGFAVVGSVPLGAGMLIKRERLAARDVIHGRVMIASPDSDSRGLWASTLHQAGFSCSPYASAENFPLDVAADRFDVLIVDEVLPTEPIFNAVQRTVASRRPGLLVVAEGVNGDGRSRALENGVDCYLARPVSSEEVAYATRNLCRRLKMVAEPVWLLDNLRWRLIAPNGLVVRLTMNEHQFLHNLFGQPGHPVKREIIVEALQKTSSQVHNRGLDVMVRRLRKKIQEKLDLDPPLVTLHGFGFAFSARGRMIRFDGTDAETF